MPVPGRDLDPGDDERGVVVIIDCAHDFDRQKNRRIRRRPEPLVLAPLKDHIGIQTMTTRDTCNRRVLDRRLGHNRKRDADHLLPRLL